MAQLSVTFPQWLHLGKEVSEVAIPIPLWIKSQVITRMLPTKMAEDLMAHPELGEDTESSLQGKIRWVKARIDYFKG